jgi:membrane-associated phospholipid phosphatase
VSLLAFILFGFLPLLISCFTYGRTLSRLFGLDDRRPVPARVVNVGLLLLIGALLPACATLPNGHRWGQDVTVRPGWRRIGQAASHAARAPGTWIPAAGALTLQIGGRDQALSSWAVAHAPLFGSRETARRASEDLLDATTAVCVLTALATPGGDEPAPWLLAKAKGIAVGAAAVAATHGTTTLLKQATHRTRPDQSNRRSFPSGHASSAAVRATLASKNLDCIPLPRCARWALHATTFSLAAGTAWARVEGKLHYPSDALAGLALGNFLGAFFNDAFLGADCPLSIGLTVTAARGRMQVAVRCTF